MNCYKCPINWDCEIDEETDMCCGCEIGQNLTEKLDAIGYCYGDEFWKE